MADWLDELRQRATAHGPTTPPLNTSFVVALVDIAEAARDLLADEDSEGQFGMHAVSAVQRAVHALKQAVEER
jgi:hypothetical protein